MYVYVCQCVLPHREARTPRESWTPPLCCHTFCMNPLYPCPHPTRSLEKWGGGAQNTGAGSRGLFQLIPSSTKIKTSPLVLGILSQWKGPVHLTSESSKSRAYRQDELLTTGAPASGLGKFLVNATRYGTAKSTMSLYTPVKFNSSLLSTNRPFCATTPRTWLGAPFI